MKVDEVLNKLKTSTNGLTNKEAQKRLSSDGKNVIEKAKKMSFLKCFFKQFRTKSSKFIAFCNNPNRGRGKAVTKQ